MNYYLLTEEQYKELKKENVSFMRKNIEGTERVVSTTEKIEDSKRKFNSNITLSNYTSLNHIKWVGDGTRIDKEEIDEEIYIKELDN
jgi:hypothetical protein